MAKSNDVRAAALQTLHWAEPHPTIKNAVLVDPDKAYPAVLEELGVEKVDQYWLEVAYQFIKMDLQRALGFHFIIHVRSDDGRKKRWNQSMHPEGKGAAAATQGREAREHYRRLRGFVPA